MEREAYFLIVAYSQILSSSGELETVIKRLAMQRRERHGESYKRIRIDFNPTEQQEGYLVVLKFDFKGNKKIGSPPLNGEIEFVGIFKDSESALEVKKELEKGGYKKYMEKGRKFISCDVYSQIITQY